MQWVSEVTPFCPFAFMSREREREREPAHLHDSIYGSGSHCTCPVLPFFWFCFSLFLGMDDKWLVSGRELWLDRRLGDKDELIICGIKGHSHSDTGPVSVPGRSMGDPVASSIIFQAWSLGLGPESLLSELTMIAWLGVVMGYVGLIIEFNRCAPPWIWGLHVWTQYKDDTLGHVH